MAQTERTGPVAGAGPKVTTTTVASVPLPTDVERAHRCLRLHHQLVRRYRWSKELDRHLGECLDPWVFAWPAVDVFRDGKLGWPERAYAGRQLVPGWSP